MSPATHLLASWIVAAKTTDNPRDCRLVTLAGVMPDLDGLGLLVDAANRALRHHQICFYQLYHHYLLHGVFGGFLITGILTLFARRRWRVALLALLVFHLHLVCDFVGSRGPAPEDLWPIFYFGPFGKSPMWVWKGQWRLEGWQNRLISVTLFAWALWLPVRLGHSVVGVFNRRADRTFVAILRKWHASLTGPQGALIYLRRPPWRTLVPGLVLIGGLFGGYGLWQPGLEIHDGRHDRLRNGIWLGHGWLGADEWFIRNGKTNETSRFRDPTRIRNLAVLLKEHHIRDVFPHLCPADANGNLPALDDTQAERFLAGFSGFRVMPWIGGPNGPSVRYHDPRVENLANALRGIHGGLGEGIPPFNYQGVALYSEWEMNTTKWECFREEFLRK